MRENRCYEKPKNRYNLEYTEELMSFACVFVIFLERN